ncbi:hypothetical protein WN51_00036 [Melipona quadrifasciata]|uniref:Uncharacterized protein n=1 Tax=Melipona quadrifasciata TaxID=166423 RepID=A0A0M8ZME1_9HYME|nr:hypothetical protein WN51_00036 [Melipona quadrifasciata]
MLSMILSYSPQIKIERKKKKIFESAKKFEINYIFEISTIITHQRFVPKIFISKCFVVLTQLPDDNYEINWLHDVLTVTKCY